MCNHSSGLPSFYRDNGPFSGSLGGVPVIVHDMTDEEYHSRDELSSSAARTLLPDFGGSPAKFQHARRHKRTSSAYDVGHAVHAKVLGVGLQAIAYPEDLLASNGAASTKAAKEWAESVRIDGLVPMKAAELAPINSMSEAVLAHPTARALFEISRGREVSVFGDVSDVSCRARFDALSEETPNGIFGIDLKTIARTADADTFTREVIDYGYHVQQEFYRDTYRASTGAEMNFLFVVVEKSAPHLVAVHQLDVVYQQMGKTLAREARRIYAECIAKNEWPGYPTDVQLVGPPVWAAMRHEEKYGE